jgi:proteic killer suppression protein
MALEVRFRDESFAKLEQKAEYSAGHPEGIVKAFRKRMQQIRAASDERDFFALRSLNFEKLKGGRSHQYSMRLNDQWRLILEFQGTGKSKKVIVVAIEDYH